MVTTRYGGDPFVAGSASRRGVPPPLRHSRAMIDEREKYATVCSAKIYVYSAKGGPCSAGVKARWCLGGAVLLKMENVLSAATGRRPHGPVDCCAAAEIVFSPRIRRMLAGGCRVLLYVTRRPPPV